MVTGSTSSSRRPAWWGCRTAARHIGPVERIAGQAAGLGGEGLFLATLSGHGAVWLQSLPFSRLADRILAAAAPLPGASKGEGSMIGDLARAFER